MKPTVTENRLLVVDDDARITRLVDRVAGKLGFETRAINDANDFESEFSARAPRVVLLDLNMPGRDGIELLRYLADQRTDAAIVLMSGVDSRAISASRRLGEELGLNMAGILQKPVDADTIRAELVKHYRANEKITDTDLSRAIENDEIFVCYQPKINLRSGEISGVEALVRWRHPIRGEIFPDAFIPLAEQSKLVVPLTYKVLATALKDSKPWTEMMPDMSLAINLSPSLLTDLTLPDRIMRLLDEHGYDPGRLVLEVTETGAMEDPTHSMDILTRLRIKGVRLSIDDFGTGSSSLVQLYRLPYSELKIDKSFVMDAMVNDEAAAIVRSTISLAHSLELDVVAEGVEDGKTLEWLKDLGCDVGQGYYFSRPIEAPDLLAWIAERAR